MTITHKITLILFKYIPAICIVGTLLNNMLYYIIVSDVLSEDILPVFEKIPYFLDGITGISVIQLFLLFLISIKFKYCAWHRVLLINCAANLLLAIMDAFGVLEIMFLDYLQLIATISIVCCSIAAIIHIHNIRQGHRIYLSEHSISSRFDHFMLGFIKWFPIIQLCCFLLSNLIATFDGNIYYCYALDFCTGNSFLFTLFLFFLSLRLGFPLYHRLLIVANLINLSIAFCEANIYSIPAASYLMFYCYYWIAPSLCLLVILFNHIKDFVYEHQTQTSA